MGIRINTNIASVNAQRQLRGTQSKLSTSFEQLASGRRINKSADDAAGLAISESLNSSVRSYMQSGRNAQDGISFIQVAEGGMSEVANMVTRIRELSVQAASDTVGQNERSYLDREAQQMKLEIERIANSTKFNGQSLLNGQGSKLDFQVGVGNDEFLDRISYDPSATDVTLSKLGLGSIDLSSKSSAQNGLNYIDDSINVINSNRSVLGSLQNRLGTTIANNEVAVENFQAAKSRILDADMASVSSDLARETVKTQASTSVLAQANMGTQAALKLIG
jgi:flagellin